MTNGGKPEPVRQYATTEHAPGAPDPILKPPEGEGWEMEGLQTQDGAGNLVYLWSRLRPGLHAVPDDGQQPRLPLSWLQAVCQLVTVELETRLQRQIDQGDLASLALDGDAFRQGLCRASRVVQTLRTQVSEGQLPAEWSDVVRPEPEPEPSE